MKRFAFLSLIILSGCKFSFDTSSQTPVPVPSPAPNPLAGCWDSNVKYQESQLAQRLASVPFGKSLPGSMSDQDATAVKNSFNLVLSNFETFTYNKDYGSLGCAASFSYTYTRPDGTTFTHDNGDILSFEVHQGESGLVPSMNGDDASSISSIEYQISGNGSN